MYSKKLTILIVINISRVINIRRFILLINISRVMLVIINISRGILVTNINNSFDRIHYP